MLDPRCGPQVRTLSGQVMAAYSLSLADLRGCLIRSLARRKGGLDKVGPSKVSDGGENGVRRRLNDSDDAWTSASHRQRCNLLRTCCSHGQAIGAHPPRDLRIVNHGRFAARAKVSRRLRCVTD